MIPPAAVGILLAQRADLDAAGRAVDEASLPDIETDMGDRTTLVGEGEDITRQEHREVPGDFPALSRLVHAPPREGDPVLAIGVLNETGAIEAAAVGPGAAPPVRAAHHLARGRDDGVGQPGRTRAPP